jgi:hypothetical protein
LPYQVHLRVHTRFMNGHYLRETYPRLPNLPPRRKRLPVGRAVSRACRGIGRRPYRDPTSSVRFPSFLPEQPSPASDPYIPVEYSPAWQKWKKMQSQTTTMQHHLDGLKR